ncbi:GlsB/YeaQ/YmgE family stress response membrane protein [Streptomyces gobiensis]|uniref:GlsB/YeaQ/YmgE family stress response membrane protein n=1 Tax=Streptomyces gobiensis TaxID=2875706 RepID=UPI001E57644B|nr:GlsB/YeaQ/YmgE family stress response membrane protein [Streptomyces gobiensis]UGY90647.1 GlsB/YeaQ/YmgE family stress response membrane protein [Streptomyces gobiensis]
MSWLWAIILGLILGVLARVILPGKQAIPIWLTIIFGVLGALLGNAVASWIGVADTRGIDWVRHLLQLGGAVLIVALGTPLWGSVRGRKTR